MAWRLLAAALMLIPALLGAPALAQDAADALAIDPDAPVALVADAVSYDSEAGTLTASGNVEVYYADRTLTADSITYDSRTERISAEGDIVLRDPTGTTVFADTADLDVELYDGIVRGAQSVISSQIPGEEPVEGDGSPIGRIAAVEARRFEGRFNALNKAVYSPCDVCEDNPTPLWRIRARRIIHDEEAAIIHYEGATFDVFGVPIAWLPYFRHPDPTNERSSGFLVPDLRTSGNYGLGLRVPYFWAVDESTDITFQPFFTTDDGIFFDAELRRAFNNGNLFFRGSLGKTDFTGQSQFDGHVDTRAIFGLDETLDGLEWGWNIKFSSDDAYLRFFDISDEDRLNSELFLRRYTRDTLFEVTGLYFQSLRDGEPAGPIPLVLPDFQFRHEVEPEQIGGTFGIFADTQSLFRDVGTDTSRLSIGIDFEREEILPIGLAVRAFGELRGDVFLTFEDEGDGDDDVVGRFVPVGGIEARYPLIYDEADGDAHIFEPIAQFVVSPFGLNDEDIPNEDSQQTEFDELNLFDISRFSGLDVVEEGPRFNLGLRYERLSDDGLGFSANVGRSFRFSEAAEFQEGSGLDEQLSDYVASWRASFQDIVSLQQRLRIADDGSVNRNEIFGNLAYGPGELSVGYVFLEESPVQGAEEDREEITARGGLQITPEWGIEGFMQRDLQESEFVEVGGTLSYANECCAVDMFLRRRFTESEDTPADTSFGVQVRLLTLGAENARPALFGPTTFEQVTSRSTADDGLFRGGGGGFGSER